MYTLIVKNKYGEQLEITHNPKYAIANIDGFDPPDSTINTTQDAGQDGSVYNSSRINDRTITITLAVNSPAEDNRIELYQYFKTKFPVRLYYKNGRRNVYIDGYVQSFQVAYFDKKETVQIVVTCPKPLLNGAESNIQEFSSIISSFEFPFSIAEEGIEFSRIELDLEKSIINNGDIETGASINIHAIGTVVNPKIVNETTDEHMFFNLTLHDGDTLIINTRKGEKNITLRSGGEDINKIGSLVIGSKWLTLNPDDNVFMVTADSNPENMVTTFDIIDQFEGV